MISLDKFKNSPNQKPDMKKNEKFRPRQLDYGEVSSTLNKLKFSLKILMAVLLLIVLMKSIVYKIYTQEISSPPKIEKYLNRIPKRRKKKQSPQYDYYGRKIREHEEERVRVEMDLLKRLNLPETLLNNARTINLGTTQK